MALFRGTLTLLFNADSGQAPDLNCPLLIFEPVGSSGNWDPGETQRFRKTENETKAGAWFHIYVKRTEGTKRKYSKISLFGAFLEEPYVGRFALTLRDTGDYPDLGAAIVESFREFEGSCAHNAKIVTHFSNSTADGSDHSDSSDWDIDKIIPYGSVFVFHTFWIGSFLPGLSGRSVRSLVDFYNSDHADLSGESEISYETSTGEQPIKFDECTSLERMYISDGDVFSVFKKRLHKDPSGRQKRLNWLTGKTFLFNVNKTNFYVRLAKTGVIEVREAFSLSSVRNFRDASSLRIVLANLLRYRKQGSTPPESNTTKNLLLEVVRAFVVMLFRKFESSNEIDEDDKIELRREIIRELDCVKPPGQTPGSAPSEPIDSERVIAHIKRKISRERQRYIVILLHRLETEEGNWLSPAALHKQATILQNLLEGTMVFSEKSKRLDSPATPPS